MSPDSSSDERDPVERLAEEFVARHRRGERPLPAEYAERHPQWGDRIRALFPALLLMEQNKPGVSDRSDFGEDDGPRAAPLEQLGDYRIIREIGRGGMAVVYEAEQVSLGRHVALKVLPPQVLPNPKQRQRFEREARSAARLHHTNIVPVFGVGEEGGLHYYVMQYIQGLGLDEVLSELRRLKREEKSAGPGPVAGEPKQPSQAMSAEVVARSLLSAGDELPRHVPVPGVDEAEGEGATLPCRRADGASSPSAARALSGSSLILPGKSGEGRGSKVETYWHSVARIGVQVAEALAYAHQQGVLHRDIKPSNLLLDAHGTAWVTDFGLAKAGTDSDLTNTGDVVGTLRYMAPERFRGTSERRSDVYGLGMTLYELLTLGPAFVGTDRERLIHQITQSEPPRPSRLNPGVPHDLETIVLKAIDREPSHRYQTADELAEDLRRFLDDRPVRARRASLGERAWRWCRRNPALAGLTVVAAALVVLVATVSSVGYIQTTAALGREALALREVVRQRDQAEGHLYHSLVGEARALRMARFEGYRRQAWDRLGRALRLATPARDVGTLRREAVACLGDFVGLEPAVVEGFPSPIVSLALHPGAGQVAIGLRDGEVHVRRVTDGGPIAVLSGQASAAIDLAFGPEGHSLMSLHADGSLRLCTRDPERGWACSRTIKVGEEMTPPLAAPVPRRFVFVRRDKGLMLRDLADGTMIHLETRDADTFNTLYSGRLGPRSDSRFAALPYSRGNPNGDEPYGVLVWDIRTGREFGRAISPIGECFGVSFSPDSRLMACNCDEGLLVHELPSLRQRSVVRWDSVQEAHFSPDGRYLAAATLSGLVKIWSTSTDREVATLRQSGDGLYHCLAFSDDGRALAMSGERKVRVWDLAETTERRALAGHSGGVTSAVFSPDGAQLASTGKDRVVRIWDPATGRLCRTLSGYNHSIEAAAFSPDGRMLATGDWGGRIRVWDARSWAELGAPRDEDLGEISCVVFSRDGKYLAGSGEKGMKIWRLSPGEGTGGDRPRPMFEPVIQVPGSMFVCAAFSPDGKLVAFVHEFRGVHLWDLANGREVPLRGPALLSGYGNLSFRPGGRQLAFVTSRGIGEVWDTTAGTRVLSLGDEGAFASPTSSISPSGRWFAGQSSPAGVALWDLGRRELAFSLREECSPVWSHAWSPDERRLAIGLSDGGLCIWDLHEVQSRLAELGLGWR
jgi:serine/threonine protein kinase/WD40 repeat protein